PPKEGMAATVAALVRNPGSIATGPFVVRFFRGDPDAGGSLIGESTIPTLAAFGEATVAVTWSPVDARGVQGISVVADALGQAEEYDETDTRAFRPIGVLGLPDLVLTTGDVVLEPRYPRAGEPVVVRATVRNIGGLLADASSVRAVEGEPGTGPAFAEVAVPPLPPGSAVTVTLAWTPAAPPGERPLTLPAHAP